MTQARTARGRSGVLAVCLAGVTAATFVAVAGLAFAPYQTARAIGIVMTILIVILTAGALIAWYRRPHELWVCDRLGEGWVMIFSSGDQTQVHRAQRALERAIERAGEVSGDSFGSTVERSTAEALTADWLTAEPVVRQS